MVKWKFGNNVTNLTGVDGVDGGECAQQNTLHESIVNKRNWRIKRWTDVQIGNE